MDTLQRCLENIEIFPWTLNANVYISYSNICRHPMIENKLDACCLFIMAPRCGPITSIGDFRRVLLIGTAL